MSVCARAVQLNFPAQTFPPALYKVADVAEYYNSLSISAALSGSKDLIGSPLACCDFEYRKSRTGTNLRTVNVVVLDFSSVFPPSKRALERECGNDSVNKQIHQEQTNVLRRVFKM